VAAPNHRTPHAPNHYFDTLQGSKETTILLRNQIGESLEQEMQHMQPISRYFLRDEKAPASREKSPKLVTPIVERLVAQNAPRVVAGASSF